MWHLTNRTPFAVGRNWIRDQDGVHWWLVAIRATYYVDPGGRLTLFDEQVPPVLAPEHFGEPGRSRLRHDSDLLEVKPSTDILVHAQLRDSEAGSFGLAMSKAVLDAAAGLSLPDQAADAVYCDINGERYRSEEWGLFATRDHAALRSLQYQTF